MVENLQDNGKLVSKQKLHTVSLVSLKSIQCPQLQDGKDRPAAALPALHDRSAGFNDKTYRGGKNNVTILGERTSCRKQRNKIYGHLHGQVVKVSNNYESTHTNTDNTGTDLTWK